MRFIRLFLALVMSATPVVVHQVPAAAQDDPEQDKQEVSLRLWSSRDRLVFGKRVRLVAKLPVHDSAENRVLRIFKKPAGASRAKLLARGRADEKGRLIVRARPSRNTTYEARWSGDGTYAAARSVTRSVDVKLRMRERLAGHYGKWGKWHVFAQDGRLRVRVNARPRRSGTTWLIMQTRNSKGWSRYPYKLDPTSSSPHGFKTKLEDGVATRIFGPKRLRDMMGKMRVRALWLGDGKHVRSVSPWRYFEVSPGLP